MIAIPIDNLSEDPKSSLLFGNVNMFAIYNPDKNSFTFVQNDGSGNGIKTAKFLKEQGATSTVYSYMGDGPFNELSKDGVDVFYIGKEALKITKIVKQLEDNDFIKVDASNASTYLDPGTATENCQCGCK